MHFQDTHVLAVRIANVIRGLDADVIAIEEGPSNVTKMKLFVEKYLGNKSVLGARQRVSLLPSLVALANVAAVAGTKC